MTMTTSGDWMLTRHDNDTANTILSVVKEDSLKKNPKRIYYMYIDFLSIS